MNAPSARSACASFRPETALSDHVIRVLASIASRAGRWPPTRILHII
ncbi:MAG: hypothetical protein HY717_17785 [Planctomycetes bacterium]|nr:hypothetical protein [Planctomycetota bacterium]